MSQALVARRLGVTPEHVSKRIWRLIQKPQRAIYIPAWLAVAPWIEACFGWLIDRLGALLLNRSHQTRTCRINVARYVSFPARRR